METNYYFYRSCESDVAIVTSNFGYTIDDFTTYAVAVKYYMARYDLFFDGQRVVFYPSQDYCMIDYPHE